MRAILGRVRLVASKRLSTFPAEGRLVASLGRHGGRRLGRTVARPGRRGHGRCPPTTLTVLLSQPAVCVGAASLPGASSLFDSSARQLVVGIHALCASRPPVFCFLLIRLGPPRRGEHLENDPRLVLSSRGWRACCGSSGVGVGPRRSRGTCQQFSTLLAPVRRTFTCSRFTNPRLEEHRQGPTALTGQGRDGRTSLHLFSEPVHPLSKRRLRPPRFFCPILCWRLCSGWSSALVAVKRNLFESLALCSVVGGSTRASLHVLRGGLGNWPCLSGSPVS